MKLNAKDVLIPTVALFIICLVVTALLAGTNLLTADTIAQQEIAAAEASRKVVLSTAESFEEMDDGETQYYIGKDGAGAVAGYVFTTTAKGYGGDVSVMTGIDTEGKIGGVVILSHNETPGLGANAEKDSFRDQYKQTAPESGFSLIKSGSAADGQISAMTGATITSNAVTNAVNEAVALYYEVKEAA